MRKESSSAQGPLEVSWNDIELKDRLGGGSFGDVFRANWKQTPVAAKSLKKLATDQERKLALADFQLEATILKNLVGAIGKGFGESEGCVCGGGGSGRGRGVGLGLGLGCACSSIELIR